MLLHNSETSHIEFWSVLCCWREFTASGKKLWSIMGRYDWREFAVSSNIVVSDGKVWLKGEYCVQQYCGQWWEGVIEGSTLYPSILKAVINTGQFRKAVLWGDNADNKAVCWHLILYITQTWRALEVVISWAVWIYVERNVEWEKWIP